VNARANSQDRGHDQEETRGVTGRGVLAGGDTGALATTAGASGVGRGSGVGAPGTVSMLEV